MPDLIIKPAAQSGNKVIIQDQAGGAVITTADSGATIANATLTSPTLNSPILVTPALGTVATGNLSNSAIVYPAGHIIQTTTVVYGTTDTSLNIGNNSWTDTVMTGSITTSGATNSVMIHCGFTFYVYNTSGDSGMALRYKKVHSGGTSYPDQCSTYDGGGNFHSAYYSDQAENHVDYYHFSMQDPTCGVAGSITYTLQGGEYNAENIGIGNGAGMNGRWYIYFQEIQR
jgi:hypothetical protein